MSDFIKRAKKQFGVIINSEEVGFAFPYIMEIIKLYEENEIPIMGGDVYIRKGKKYVPAYDNWYFNKADAKVSFLKESIAATREYILKYPKENQPLFVLVPN